MNEKKMDADVEEEKDVFDLIYKLENWILKETRKEHSL